MYEDHLDTTGDEIRLPVTAALARDLVRHIPSQTPGDAPSVRLLLGGHDLGEWIPVGIERNPMPEHCSGYGSDTIYATLRKVS